MNNLSNFNEIFRRKMWLMIILKVIDKNGYIFERATGGPPPSSRLRFKHLLSLRFLKYNIFTCISHISGYINKMRVSVTYLIIITFINNRKKLYSMRISFLIFTKIAKLNTRKMFWNHQVAKLNTRKMKCFSKREIKYPLNSIPSFKVCFLPRPFTIHRTAGEAGGYFFNSSVPLPPSS